MDGCPNFIAIRKLNANVICPHAKMIDAKNWEESA